MPIVTKYNYTAGELIGYIIGFITMLLIVFLLSHNHSFIKVTMIVAFTYSVLGTLLLFLTNKLYIQYVLFIVAASTVAQTLVRILM